MKKFKTLLLIFLLIGFSTVLFASCKNNNEENNQTISFICGDVDVDGDMPDSIYLKPGKVIDLPECEATKDNYYFYCWSYLNNEYMPDDTFVVPSSDVVFEAVFKINQFELVVNNGTGGGVYDYGTQVTISANDLQDKVFDYWDINGSKVYDKTTNINVTEGIVATAYYKNLFTVNIIGGYIFSINDIEQEAGLTQKVLVDQDSIVIKANAPEEGKEFNYWAYSENGSNISVENPLTLDITLDKLKTNNINLYAIFGNIPISVELNSDYVYQSEYYKGEDINLNNVFLKVTTYNSVKNIPVDSSMVEGFSSATVGEVTAYIKYKDDNGVDHQKPIKFTIKEAYSLSIESGYGYILKSEYNNSQTFPAEGENIDIAIKSKIFITGSKVTINILDTEYDSKKYYFVGWKIYENGSTEPSEITDTNKKVTIELDKNITVKAIIEEVQLESISVIENDAIQVKYWQNYHEEFNLDNLYICASYNNNSTENIKVTDLMISGFDINSIGEKELLITYEGEETTLSYEILASYKVQCENSYIYELDFENINITTTNIKYENQEGVRVYYLPSGAQISLKVINSSTTFLLFNQWLNDGNEFDEPKCQTDLNYKVSDKNTIISTEMVKKEIENITFYEYDDEYALNENFSEMGYVSVLFKGLEEKTKITYTKDRFIVENFDTTELAVNKKAKLYYIDKGFKVELLEFYYSVYTYFKVDVYNGYIYSVDDVVLKDKPDDSYKSGSKIVVYAEDKSNDFLQFSNWNADLNLNESIYVIENLNENVVLNAFYVEFEIQSIELVDGDYGTEEDNNKLDYKTEYLLNESIDISNMYIKVNYVGGGSKKVSLNIGNINDFSTLLLGDYTATINYKSIQTTFDYTVVPAENETEYQVVINNGKIIEVDGISIKTNLSSCMFIKGSNFKIVPVVGDNQYFNGWFDVSNILVSNEYELIVENLTENLNLTAQVLDDAISSITVLEGYIKEYNHNNEISFEGLLINIKYNSGKEVLNFQVDASMIDEEYPYSTESIGQKTAKINYTDEFGNQGSVKFVYKVNKALLSLELTSDITEYYINETAENVISNISATALFSDGSSDVISNDRLTFNEFLTSNVATIQVSATYTYNNISRFGLVFVSFVKAPEINKISELNYNINGGKISLSWQNTDTRSIGFNVYFNDTKMNTELIEVNNQSDYIYTFEYDYIDLDNIKIESVPTDSFNYSSSFAEIVFDLNYNLLTYVRNLNETYDYNVVINDYAESLVYIYGQNANITYNSISDLSDLTIINETAYIEDQGFIFYYENENGEKQAWLTSKFQNNLYSILYQKVLSKLFDISRGVNFIDYTRFIYSADSMFEYYRIEINDIESKIYAFFKVYDNKIVSIEFKEQVLSEGVFVDYLFVNCSQVFETPELNYEESLVKFELTVDDSIVESVSGIYSGNSSNNIFIKGEKINLVAKDIIDNKAFYNWEFDDGDYEYVYTSYTNPTEYYIYSNVVVSVEYFEYLEITTNYDYINVYSGKELGNGSYRLTKNFEIYLDLPVDLTVDETSLLVFEFDTDALYKFELPTNSSYSYFNVDSLMAIEEFASLVETYGKKFNVYIDKLIPRYNITFNKGVDSEIYGYDPDFEQGYYNSGDKITLPKNSYLKLRYEFIGWSDGDSIYSESEEYIVSKNVEFVPVFEEKQYLNEITITFIDTLNNLTTYQYIDSGECAIPDYRLTSDDYYLAYWYKQGDSEPFDFSQTISEPTTFETNWINKNNLTLEVDYENNYAVITEGCNVIGESVEIDGKTYIVSYLPKYYMGYEVKKIGDYAFSNYSSNVQIFVSNSIEIIGYAAFGKTNNLINNKIIGLVAEIDENSFVYNSSIKYIDDYAFANLFYFEYFNIGELSDLTHIGNYAFRYTLLENVVIRNKVEYIGKSAFESAFIKNLTFEQGGENDLIIDDFAFYDSMRNWGNAGSFISDESSFIKFNYLNVRKDSKSESDSYEIVLPNRLTKLGMCAFMQLAYDGYSSGINSVKLNSSIELIGDGALAIQGLESLVIYDYVNEIEVNITNNSRYELRAGILYELDENFSQVKLLLIVSDYSHTFENKSLYISNTIEHIGAYALFGLKSDVLTEITVPQTVLTIGKGAFIICGNDELLTIKFDGDLPSIVNNEQNIIKAKNFELVNENANVKILINFENLNNSIEKVALYGENILSNIIVVATKTSENDLNSFVYNESSVYDIFAYESIVDLISDNDIIANVTNFVENQIYYCKLILRDNE